MGKRILLPVFVAGLLILGIMGTCLAGIEPVPWQPELNKLQSIELNIASIQKRLDKLSESDPLPKGTVNYLNAMGNQLDGLDTRLADTLYLLPPFSQLDTETQEEVSSTLDTISEDASNMIDIFDDIAERMGVEPTPWREILSSITIRISLYVDCSSATCD